MKKIILMCSLLLLVGCDINNKVDNTNSNGVLDKDNVNSNEVTDINNNETVDKDNIIIKYFNDAKDKIIDITSKENIENSKEKIKQTFITLADFIFYDGEIKGIKFNELKEDTKEVIYKIFNSIDNQIIKVWPNYKEDISISSNKVYTTIKDKINDALKYLEDKLKDKYGEDKVEDTKDKIDDVKDTIKDKLDTIKDNIKNWYENLKNN